MALATATPDGAAVGADGAAQGPRARRLRVLHQRREPQGRRDPRQSARGAAVPLEVAAPAGAHRGPARGSRARRWPTPTSPRAIRIRGSARPPRTSRARSIRARPTSTGSRRCARDYPGRRRCRARRTGPASAWRPSGSSSGSRARTGCTSGACSPAPAAWTSAALSMNVFSMLVPVTRAWLTLRLWPADQLQPR